MLDPHHRQDLFSALRPPAGYALDHAIGTTFTLDLMAALTVPLAFSLFGSDTNDPLALLQAVQANAERLTLFCQAGRISIPTQYQALFGYLEPRIVQVTAPKKNGVFHPKVWVLRFVSMEDSAESPILYRLLVASRNLTFDRSWDTLLCLDGKLTTRKIGFGRNRPLSEFVAALPKLAQHPIPAGSPIKQIADELRRVAFDVPHGFDSNTLEFVPIGHNGRKHWPFPKQHSNRLLVISPFLTANALQQLAPTNGRQATLITRLAEVQKLSGKQLAAYSRIFVLDGSAEMEDEAESDHALTGLHAKLFLYEQRWDATLWTGSANATNAAFSNNVEFMVKLSGKKSRIGIDKLLPADMQSGLGKLLMPYMPADAELTDDTQLKLEAQLETTRRQLADVLWQAHVKPYSEQEWTLTLSGNELAMSKGITAEIRPISLGDGYIRMLPAPACEWTAVSFQALTSFFAFTLTAREGNVKASLHFVLNVPLDGMPDDRQDRLIRSLLIDQNAVLRYLRLLLADTPLALLSAEGWQTSVQVAAGDERGVLNSAELFESFVRTLAKQPERLPSIARVIDSLRDTPNRLPEGLLTIWEPIWRAYNELHEGSV